MAICVSEAFVLLFKKRIEKVQHDGLLKSTDDESFDQCVSCLSVIHVSRQGASYFITYTDDFSRYGYVYLVFESFKDYALEFATRIFNMVSTKKVDKTPYEIWYGKVPILSYLKVWRCQALMKHDTPNTLQQRSIKCIFVGYPKETMGYYFYYQLENKIFVAREDAKPSENTSLHQHEVEHDTIEPQTDVIAIRRSARIPQAPERYGFYIDAKEHELRDHREPPNYQAALSDPESEKWLEAMNAEMQSMKDNQVLNLVDLPFNCKTVRSKWIFKKKTDMDGNMHTYKAHLVAKGFTQTYEVDY
ncbi:retrotransposon protein, putative, ty1-copia subclass, partial [Tanacetum coccineum]